MDQLPAIDEACRKAGVVWVDFGEGSRVAWHLWHDDALWLVCGGLEQDLPGVPNHPHHNPDPAEDEQCHIAFTALAATVIVRAPDDHPLRFTAAVTPVEPGSDEWASVVPLLHEKRLNPPDGEAQPDRWARESLILRLTPRDD